MTCYGVKVTCFYPTRLWRWYTFFVVTAILGTVHKHRLKYPPLFGGWICLLLQMERRKRITYSAGPIRMRIFKSLTSLQKQVLPLSRLPWGCRKIQRAKRLRFLLARYNKPCPKFQSPLRPNFCVTCFFNTLVTYVVISNVTLTVRKPLNSHLPVKQTADSTSPRNTSLQHHCLSPLQPPASNWATRCHGLSGVALKHHGLATGQNTA
jgi:hypothetical protein